MRRLEGWPHARLWPSFEARREERRAPQDDGGVSLAYFDPNALKVMMVWVSWMPAPPEESEPAMVSAIGVVIAGLAQMVGSGP